MKLLAVVVTAVLLAGCATTTSPDTGIVDATPAPPSARPPVTLSGPGIGFSTEFTLDGDYRVTWRAEPADDRGCYHGAFLERRDAPHWIVMVANRLLTTGDPATGESQVADAPFDGRYYLEVPSGCRWEFTFEPS